MTNAKPRASSLFARLDDFLGGFRRGQLAIVTSDDPPPAIAPLETAKVGTPVSSLAVLGMLDDLSRHLKVDLFNSRTYQILDDVLGRKGPRRNEDEEAYLAFQALVYEGPSPTKRKRVARVFIKTEELDTRLENMSQTSWEALQRWVNHNE